VASALASWRREPSRDCVSAAEDRVAEAKLPKMAGQQQIRCKHLTTAVAGTDVLNLSRTYSRGEKTRSRRRRPLRGHPPLAIPARNPALGRYRRYGVDLRDERRERVPAKSGLTGSNRTRLSRLVSTRGAADPGVREVNLSANERDERRQRPVERPDHEGCPGLFPRTD
jgi:hypothetical protein